MKLSFFRRITPEHDRKILPECRLILRKILRGTLTVIACLALNVPVLISLGGCSKSMQPENQAYIISMGIDITDDGEIMLTVQLPKIGEESASESGSSKKSGYLIASASGKSFSQAYSLLNATVPRRLTPAHIKTLIVSKKTASSEKLLEIVDAITDMNDFYTASAFIVSKEAAADIIEKQQPVIGTRLSEAVSAELDHYQDVGSIPPSTLADFIYATRSGYSDPVAVYVANATETGESAEQYGIPGTIDAKQKPEGKSGGSAGSSGGSGSSGGGSGGSGGGSGDSGGSSGSSGEAGNLSRVGENASEYIGCALFREGRMIGLLTGDETQLRNVLSGASDRLTVTIGNESITLFPTTPARCTLQNGTLTVSLFLKLSESSQHSDPTTIRDALQVQTSSLIRKCQSLNTEPFSFSQSLASHYATQSAYQRSARREYQNAEVKVEITVESET